MSGWCHKCGYTMCLCDFNERRPSVERLRAENERLTARLAVVERLWRTAIENEGTDWANGIIVAAKGAQDGQS